MAGTERQTWRDLARDAGDEFYNNILPWWIPRADREQGGYFGRIERDNSIKEDAPKGLVMHARLLWTFSAARRFRYQMGCHAAYGCSWSGILNSPNMKFTTYI